MSDVPTDHSTGRERAYARLQRLLPQHTLSALMHRAARSRTPMVRNVLIRTVLRAYPMIDMTEAADPDPYAYESFNAFFTRALRAGLRPIAPGDGLVSPVDGTLSQLGAIESGQLLQAKGHPYSIDALLADPGATKAYTGGRFACLYLAPYNYHRIHMPCDGRLIGTRYVPGALFSVNDSTARTVPGLFARNERVVCEFETPLGRLAVVMVGAMLVGSIETVFAGEINLPGRRQGPGRVVDGAVGTQFAKGAELGRFNMGSTVIVAIANASLEFEPGLGAGATVRLGQALAKARAQ